ncbi:hypothetical protein AVEN_242183-1 [Araneus ventricosus]|uniref:Uncharacterized protein n=1 Tax=Araneus ventricosus TaxID=182803 RepID=A0A4Y2DHT9_ARAVE|nr:hypothetical protein AVEN_242183-1 [Araneus ventricosus]
MNRFRLRMAKHCLLLSLRATTALETRTSHECVRRKYPILQVLVSSKYSYLPSTRIFQVLVSSKYSYLQSTHIFQVLVSSKNGRGGGLMVRLRGRRIPHSKPGSIEDPSFMLKFKRPVTDMVRKLGKIRRWYRCIQQPISHLETLMVTVQVSSAPSDPSSELRGPSQNSPLVAAKQNGNITKTKSSKYEMRLKSRSWYTLLKWRQVAKANTGNTFI